MPQFWTRLRSSPPKRRRNEVAEACRTHGAQLIGNQIHYKADDRTCWALIRVPEGRDPDALFRELGALEWEGLVDADEKEAGKRPPPSGRGPNGS